MRDRLRRPLTLELSSGCRDDVVVGGVERLIDGLARPFAGVGALLQGYGTLSPEVRRARLERVLALLDEAGDAGRSPERAAKAAPRPKAEPSARSAESPVRSVERLPADGLDRALADRLVDLGAQAPRKLGEVGVRSYRDLLWSLPRRYEDRRALPHFSALESDQIATVTGSVISRKGMRSRRGMHVLRRFPGGRSRPARDGRLVQSALGREPALPGAAPDPGRQGEAQGAQPRDQRHRVRGRR